MSKPADGLASRDWDEVSQAVADAYFPHTLTPSTRLPAANVSLRKTGTGPVRIARLAWGADVSVQSEHPGAYGVNIPLTGRLDSVVGGKEVSSLPGTATVCPPDVTTLMPHWTSSCEIIGVRFDHEYLQREMHRILGRAGRPLPSQVNLSVRRDDVASIRGIAVRSDGRTAVPVAQRSGGEPDPERCHHRVRPRGRA